MGQSGQPERANNLTTVTRKSDREIVVTRTFDSPARTVFDAWTRRELFRLWWAPRSMGATLSACEIDARTGGGYRMTFGDGSDSMTFFGRYLDVTPPSRLVWTNEESADGPVTTVSFEDQGESTLLIFSELYGAAEPPADAAAGMQAMMSEQFAQLDELLASRRRAA
ncbi:MAG: SRPBCC domain-containing protein [Phenylobacterium sp.]|uniref:SRPBCC domain-containing protein n=1 Tax=Phenylobacterium sp. TaxID=1871053 RepID=UPI00273485F7|nr:SRPBCC domain-containing protein [Phenylobacterium sp.]MDP3173046.1 SRPBCC domain-containing protein [Phenylobacterium sp.]